jgi:alpha-beta hydrolase superfamily lysophospholipase
MSGKKKEETGPDLERLDHPWMAHVLFHPQREWPGHVDAATAVGGQPVTVSVRDGTLLGGWLFPLAGVAEAPVVMLFHGNGELAVEYMDLAPAYHALGVALLALDFRGYGRSGGVPSARQLGPDAVDAFHALPALFEEHGLRPKGVFILGRSLGSAPALEVAGTVGRGIAGLILDSAFAQTWALVRRLGGMIPPGTDDLRHGFPQLQNMARVLAPVLLLHGEEDWIIPADDARALAEAVCQGHREKEGEVRLVLIPGAGHNDLIGLASETYFDAVRSHLETCLQGWHLAFPYQRDEDASA